MDTIIILGILLALLFNFANGLNDAANSIATIIATKALTPLQAVLLAGVFNLLGPLLFSTAIAATIGRAIVDPAFLTPSLILMAMAGAVLWVLATSYLGIPVSSSHALIGGLLGAGIAAAGTGAVIWPSLAVIGQVLFYGLMGVILGAVVTGAFALLKGDFKPWNLILGGLIGVTVVIPLAIAAGLLKVSGILGVLIFIVISPMLGFIAAFALGTFVAHVFRNYQPRRLTSLFRNLQIFSGSFQAIGHGSNDAQNAMGIITAMLLAGGLIAEFSVPLWVILASSLAISLGTLLGGWRVIDKMANKITRIRPYQGFSASTASGSVLSLMTA
ncbi:MAG: inorganic phosphate transporter, partial [Methanoculleus sp.]|nr:inorganic phosphate transporter [Methanoculleus sp.]